MRSDAELIKDAGKRPEAFRELYTRHASTINSWLHRRTGDENFAFELTAETFAEAALSLKRFSDRAGGSAAPWLFGIASNLLRRYYKARRVESTARRRLGVPVSLQADFEEVDDRDESSRLGPALRSAVEELPEGQRRAVELRVVEERSYADVARALGCTPLAARLRVSRALGALAQSMKGATE